MQHLRRDITNKETDNPADSKRKIILFAVICALLLGAFTAWLFVPKSTEPTGTLSVNTDQPSIVSVDGEVLGNSPIEEMEISVGEHQIIIRNEQTGEEKTFEETIVEGQSASVTALWIEDQGGKTRKVAKARQNDVKKSADESSRLNPTKRVEDEGNEPY